VLAEGEGAAVATESVWPLAKTVGAAGYGRQPHRQRRRDTRAPSTGGRSSRPSTPMRT
jgi:hypothetical protein